MCPVIRLGVSNSQCGALEKAIDVRMNVPIAPWKWYNLVESNGQTIKLFRPRLVMLIRPVDTQTSSKPNVVREFEADTGDDYRLKINMAVRHGWAAERKTTSKTSRMNVSVDMNVTHGGLTHIDVATTPLYCTATSDRLGSSTD
ncbi:uncharacterized protein CLUP02_15250 [Colletotrichum lupini]|uniref:Uncharacterized protein n=1 Tax=Colletotrichum lupini TaxID=145971 RepID=A0A9Q8T5P6_9PEZI|nr:uncharacterized protein CLUP02_15250 [Colletotrichum lupini]UQC89719.1 hypothetical protein CLUP02_15250 [Colletotrichum lupini]